MIRSGPKNIYGLEPKTGSYCIVVPEQFSDITNTETDTSEIVERLSPGLSSEVDEQVTIVLEAVQDERKNEGLMQGINTASAESRRLFRTRHLEAGLRLEASGPHDEMLAFMPPLTINAVELATALDIVEARFHEAMADSVAAPTAVVMEPLLIQ